MTTETVTEVIKKRAGRPKGKVTSLKYGHKFDDATKLKYMAALIEILESGRAQTLSGAAEILHISPLSAYEWKKQNKNFEDAIMLATEVVADRIMEKILSDPKGATAQISLLKGIRPEYRDGFDYKAKNSRLENLLEELKPKHRKIIEPKPEEPEQVEGVCVNESLPTLENGDDNHSD